MHSVAQVKDNITVNLCIELQGCSGIVDYSS